MTHTVRKAGPWFKALAEVVAAAKRGDVIVVDDLEMMQYACFGIESRGFVTHDRAKGIVVHLAEGASPTGVEKGTMRGTGPSTQNIPRQAERPAPPEPARMRTADWAYGNLTAEPTKCSFNFALELLGKYHRACGETKTTKEAVAELRRAFETQTAITITAEGIAGETLLVPPDRYDAGQKFLCQFCNKEYVYGEAKAAVDGAEHRTNVRGDEYHPETFCTRLHENQYLLKHHRYPAVGAEILLSPPERCNLLDHYRASEGRVVDTQTGTPVGEVYTESYTTPADAMAVDKVAGLLGFEAAGPTTVISEAVSVNPKPKAVKLTPEQLERLRSARKFVNERYVMSPEEQASQRRSWVRGQMQLKYPDMSSERLEQLIDEALAQNPVEELFREREARAENRGSP